MKNIRFQSTACGSCEEGKSVKILTRPRHSAGHLPSPADKTVKADGRPLLFGQAVHYFLLIFACWFCPFLL